jgi:hypothetical protein
VDESFELPGVSAEVGEQRVGIERHVDVQHLLDPVLEARERLAQALFEAVGIRAFRTHPGAIGRDGGRG